MYLALFRTTEKQKEYKNVIDVFFVCFRIVIVWFLNLFVLLGCCVCVDVFEHSHLRDRGGRGATTRGWIPPLQNKYDGVFRGWIESGAKPQ